VVYSYILNIISANQHLNKVTTTDFTTTILADHPATKGSGARSKQKSGLAGN
jgi:hypothetical protein